MPIAERLMHVKNNGAQAIGPGRNQVFLCHAGTAYVLAPGDVASWPEGVVEHAYKLEYCQQFLLRLSAEEGDVVYHETQLRIAKEKQQAAIDALARQTKITKDANNVLAQAVAQQQQALKDAEVMARGDEDPFDPEKGLDLTPPKPFAAAPPAPPGKEPAPLNLGGSRVPPPASGPVGLPGKPPTVKK